MSHNGLSAFDFLLLLYFSIILKSFKLLLNKGTENAVCENYFLLVFAGMQQHYIQSPELLTNYTALYNSWNGFRSKRS